MTADWQQIDAMLDRLYDADADERRRLLDELQRDDPDLADRVRELLRGADTDEIAPGGALSTGVLAGVAADADPVSTSHPEQVGPWRIVRELGRGGMGVVYLAERAEGDFEQRVALKLLPAGPQSESLLKRFEQERRILAALEHPNIARLVDGGVTDEGAPWFAMEFVEGERIDDYCDHRRLAIDERLRLFIEVAEAVQAAHRSLIVHRDLKPANILVTGEGADGGGRVKLLDFGIAKPLEGKDATADATRTLHRVLTPEYSSPEQIRGDTITTASDVYQLGLLLHELLTGSRAHQLRDATPQGIERAVCDDPPTRPSTAAVRPPGAISGGDDPEAIAAARGTTPRRLARLLRGDLDTIVLAALRKEPRRRYSSAEQMAEDVRRYQRAIPITARPDTAGYRAGRFVRRHAAGVAATFGVLLLVGALSAAHTVRLQRERDRARLEAEKALQVSEILTELFTGADPYADRSREPTVRELLDAGTDRVRDELEDQPELQATLLTTLGGIYDRLGEYEVAESILEQAIETWDSRVAEDRVSVTDALISLAGIHREGGRFDSAERLLMRALQLREEEYGPDHERTSRALSSLGNTYEEAGRFEEAEQLQRRALAIRRQRLGNESAEVAQTLHNLGILQQHRGRFDEALTTHREELSIYQQLRGPNHPDVANAYNSIGTTIGLSGDLEASEPYFVEALEIRQRLFGDAHPHTAMTLHNLGFVNTELGRYEEAERLLRRALDGWRTLFGPGHAEVARCTVSLGRLYMVQERTAEAEELLRQGLDLWSDKQGRLHPELVGPLDNLAQLLSDDGRPDEARSFAAWALEVREAAWGPDHEDVKARRAALDDMG